MRRLTAKFGDLIRLALVASLFAALSAPTAARADSVVLPKKGMQYFTFGLSLNPGLLHDDGDGSSTTFGASGMGSVGLHQILTRNFFMSAEGQLGLQWLDEHTADKDGAAPASSNFAWQLGLYAHWLPFGEEMGLSSAVGLHLFQAHLDDAPLQVLGGELRLGKYIWTADESFLLVQLGYSAPIIQGLDQPTDFSGGEDPFEERSWTFHRFSIGFQYGF